jgi:hypothetical protein
MIVALFGAGIGPDRGYKPAYRRSAANCSQGSQVRIDGMCSGAVLRGSGQINAECRGR